jgi:hypothetical protein
MATVEERATGQRPGGSSSCEDREVDEVEHLKRTHLSVVGAP